MNLTLASSERSAVFRLFVTFARTCFLLIILTIFPNDVHAGRLLPSTWVDKIVRQFGHDGTEAERAVKEIGPKNSLRPLDDHDLRRLAPDLDVSAIKPYTRQLIDGGKKFAERGPFKSALARCSRGSSRGFAAGQPLWRVGRPIRAKTYAKERRFRQFSYDFATIGPNPPDSILTAA